MDTAQTSLDNAQLVSPVDGVVLAVNITPGVDAPSGSAITVQSNAFQVSASVAEADLPSLKLGQDANVTLTASGLTASGKVTQISPTGSSGTGGGVVTYAILVSLPTPPAGTASGMSASISITTAQATNVIAVPAISLVGSLGSYSVRVLDSSGQPQSVPVQVGLVTSSLAEIQSGIDVGTEVVTGSSSNRTTTTTTGGGGFGVPGVGGGGGAVPRRRRRLTVDQTMFAPAEPGPFSTPAPEPGDRGARSSSCAASRASTPPAGSRWPPCAAWTSTCGRATSSPSSARRAAASPR